MSMRHSSVFHSSFSIAFAALFAVSAYATPDVTGLEPRLCMTFDNQSLANTGTASATWTNEGTPTWSQTPCGYAIDTSKYVPYANYSSVFTANHASSIAVVATLGTKSTGIMVHFKNGNTAIVLRRGTTAGTLVLTRDNSTTSVLTVNNIEDGRTGVNARMGREAHVLGPGSAVRTRYDFEIGMDDMVKFEKNVDLDAFDGTAAEEVASAPGSVPDRAERVREILGPKHMLGAYSDAVVVDFILN